MKKVFRKLFSFPKKVGVSFWGALIVLSIAYFSLNLYFKIIAIRNKPEFELTYSKTINVGNQAYGNSVSTLFNIKNSGKNKITVLGFKTACGCESLMHKTSGGLNKPINVSIESNGIAEFQFDFKVNEKTRMKQILPLYFFTNAPGLAENAIVFEVPIIEKGFWFSPSFVAVGEVSPGASEKHYVKIFDSRVNRKPIILNKTLNANVAASILPAPSEHKGKLPGSENLIGTVELVVSGKTPGPISETIHVTTEDGISNPTELKITGRVKPEVEIFPKSLVFPFFQSGKPTYEGKVILVHQPEKNIDLVVSEKPRGVTVDLGISDKQSFKRQITIRLNPNELDKTPEIQLSVKLKAGSKERFIDLEIPIVVLNLHRKLMP